MNLANYLIQAIQNLIALSANTSHIVFDRLQERSSVPLVGIVEATCNETIHLNKHKMELLGTILL